MAKQDLTALVIAAQGGDQQALSDLLEESYQKLYFYAYQTVKNEDLAADITQESCLEIITTLHKLHEPSAFVVWARRITYHQCTKHFRETKEITVDADEDGETIFDRIVDESEDALPEQVQLDKEFQATMQQLLDELPSQQRTALMLYYYEKLSVSQIAEIQDTSEGTVKSRLNYGRKAVKAKVEEYEKKTGVRLHSFAPLPLLLSFLFGKQGAQVMAGCGKVLEGIRVALSGTAAAAGSGAAAVGTGAAGAATGTGATAIGTTGGAAAVGMGLGTKIAAGVVAAAVCIGGTVGGAALIDNLSGPKVPTELVGTWYGDQYTEEHTADTLILERGGTLEFHGYTFELVQVEKDEEDATGKDMELTFVYETERPDCGQCRHSGVSLKCSWLESDVDSENSYHTGPGYLISVYPCIGEHANGEKAIAPFFSDPSRADYLFNHYYQDTPGIRDDIWGSWALEAGDTEQSFTILSDHRLVYNGEDYVWKLTAHYAWEAHPMGPADRLYEFLIYPYTEDAQAYPCCLDHHWEHQMYLEIYASGVANLDKNDATGGTYSPGDAPDADPVSTDPTVATNETGIVIPGQYLYNWVTFPDEEGISSYCQSSEDSTFQIYDNAYYVIEAQPSAILLATEPDTHPYLATRRLVFHSNTFGIPAVELQKLYPEDDKEPRTLDYFWRSTDLEQLEAVTLTDENWAVYIGNDFPDTVINNSTETYLYLRNFVSENSWAEGSLVYTSTYLNNDLVINANGESGGAMDLRPGIKYPSDTIVRLTGHTPFVSYPPNPLGSVELEIDGKTKAYLECFMSPATLENVTGVVYIPKGFDAQAYWEYIH